MTMDFFLSVHEHVAVLSVYLEDNLLYFVMLNIVMLAFLCLFCFHPYIYLNGYYRYTKEKNTEHHSHVTI